MTNKPEEPANQTPGKRQPSTAFPARHRTEAAKGLYEGRGSRSHSPLAAPTIDRDLFPELPSAELLSTSLLERLAQIHSSEGIFVVAHRMDKPIPNHRLDYVEIVCVLQGRVINHIEDREMLLLPNTACIMGIECSHALEVEDPSAIVCVICLRKEIFAEGSFARFATEDNVVAQLLRGEARSPFLVFTDPKNDRIQVTITTLLDAYDRSGYHETCEVDAWTLLLLCTLAQAHSYTFTGMDRRMVAILDEIERMQGQTSVRALARQFGLTENYLTTYVRRSTGKGAAQFIREAKLTHALSLLHTTDKTIEAIAEEVGYHSHSQFYQAFSRQFGLTPGQYRKQKQP